MRELQDITKELSAVAADITAKKKALDEANKLQSDAFNAHELAKSKALGLRKELDESLNALVPESMQSSTRVRISA